VFGIPSASAVGEISNYPSEYNLYEVSARDGSWNIRASARRYDAEQKLFLERVVADFDVQRHATGD
jgi:hypothetical protein